MKLKRFTRKPTISIGFVLAALGCTINAFSQNPASDPSNDGGWVLNSSVSDEFNGVSVDENKWLIQGRNGEYQSNWKGRAPSEFSVDNAIVEDNKLKILTKWEPSYNFSNEKDGDYYYGGSMNASDKSIPVTTAAVISKDRFLYGYMEIRSKSATANITSAFWTTSGGGNGNRSSVKSFGYSELDMFEMFGNYSRRNKLKLNMIDWNSGSLVNKHVNTFEVPFDARSSMHTYGFEWDPLYLKVYIDGVYDHTYERGSAELSESNWILKFPFWVWFDSEIFTWWGLPTSSQLTSPAEFQIEYVRIWQKQNLVDQVMYSFDTENSSESWYINTSNSSDNYFSLSTNQVGSLINSLKFEYNGVTASLPNSVNIFSPANSVNIPAGDYTMSMLVYKESGSVSEVKVVVQKPWTEFKVDLSGVPVGKWVRVEKDFSRASASQADDNIRLEIQNVGGISPQSNTVVYFDDIVIRENDQSALGLSKLDNKSEVNIYPNPVANGFLNISSSDVEEISITNIAGVQLIKEDKISEPHQIDVSNLSSGVYFVSVKSGSNVETRKIFVK